MQELQLGLGLQHVTGFRLTTYFAKRLEHWRLFNLLRMLLAHQI